MHSHSPITFALNHRIRARSASKGFRAAAQTCLMFFVALATPLAASAVPHVEFDVAPIAECRDITPPERITQYPNQRLVEVALSVSVRFCGMSMDDVDELAIEVNGMSAGFRVDDFSPATQLASDISHDIETTTTSKKSRSLDGSLGGTLPVPGADAVAHLTPSISAALSNCDEATEKIKRLPPKHAVVVSGTSLEGRGVFFKLKRYSQTSLEGVHQLTVTFVAPRFWQRSAIQVDCAARGDRKMLWMKQTGTVGQSSRMVQLVAMSAKPVRQLVLKPLVSDSPAAKTETATEKAVSAAAPQWRPSRDKPGDAKAADALPDDVSAKAKKSAVVSVDAKSGK